MSTLVHGRVDATLCQTALTSDVLKRHGAVAHLRRFATQRTAVWRLHVLSLARPSLEGEGEFTSARTRLLQYGVHLWIDHMQRPLPG
jgi:hypothetical protein